MTDAPLPSPVLQPLGDAALLIRVGTGLSDAANLRAVALAQMLAADPPEGVEEVVPGLVSVLLRYRPGTDFWRLSGDVRVRIGATADEVHGREVEIAVAYDGEDLPIVASMLGLDTSQFIVSHMASPLRVLATGFAPGFVYCGFHPPAMTLPRRDKVRPMVPAGTVLFAAGQTAIAATPIRTGWHVIGRTTFQNFDPESSPPTRLAAGDSVRFSAA